MTDLQKKAVEGLSDEELAEDMRFAALYLNSRLVEADKRNLEIKIDLTRIACTGQNQTYKIVFIKEIKKTI